MAIRAAQLYTELTAQTEQHDRALQRSGAAVDQYAAHARRGAGATVELNAGMEVLGATGGKLGQILTQAAGTSAGFIAAQVVLKGVGEAMRVVEQGAIGMNAKLETATLQFETLMGDADRAREHVLSLFQIGKDTPFETGPIVEASRLFQTFGGDALNTRDNIILVGDAAAATSSKINEVAFWVGRAYSAIQSGRPFGEAAMRLQELAVLSPKARNEIEALQESGASAAQIWQVLTADLHRFDGAMAKQAKTWEGLSSTARDAVNLMISGAFRPFFDEGKKALGGVVEFLTSPEVERWSGRMATAFGEVMDVLGRFPAKADPVKQFFLELPDLMSRTARRADEVGNAFSNLGRKGQELQRGLGPIMPILRVLMGIDMPESLLPENLILAQGGPREGRGLIGGEDIQRILGSMPNLTTEALLGNAQQPPPPEQVDETAQVIRSTFATVLERARLDQLMGSQAVAALRGLDQMASQEGAQLENTKRTIAASAQAVAEQMREKLGPETGGRMAREWLAAITEAVDDGTPEAKERALAIAQAFGIDADLRAANDKNKAEMERLAREAERAAREAERASRTALRGFTEAWARAMNLEGAKARFGADVGQVAALFQEARGASVDDGAMAKGERVAEMVAGLIQKMRDVGVPNAEALGQLLASAVASGFTDGSAAMEQEVLAVFDQVAAAIRERETLSPATFEEALGLARLRDMLGSGGASLMDAWDQAAKDGGQRAIQTLGQTVVGLMRTLDGLDPERAEELARGLLDMVRRTVEEGTPEARQAMLDYVAVFNQEAQIGRAWAQMQRRIAEAESDTNRTIKQLTDDADREMGRLQRIFEASRAVMDVRPDTVERYREELELARQRWAEEPELAAAAQDRITRNAREAMQERHREELDAIKRKYEEQAEIERQAQQDRANQRQQERAAEDLQRRRQREDADAARQLTNQLAEAQRRGAKPEELDRIRTAAMVAQQERQIKRQYENEDVQIAKRRAQQDLEDARASAKALADIRILHERDVAEKRKAQATEVQQFESIEEAKSHQARLDHIKAQRDDAIAKAKERLDELKRQEQAKYAEIEREVWEPAWRRAFEIADREFLRPLKAGVNDAVAPVKDLGKEAPAEPTKPAPPVKGDFLPQAAPAAPVFIGSGGVSVPQQRHGYAPGVTEPKSAPMKVAELTLRNEGLIIGPGGEEAFFNRFLLFIEKKGVSLRATKGVNT